MGLFSFIITFFPVRAVMMKAVTAWGLNCNYSESTIRAAKEELCACERSCVQACMCVYLSSYPNVWGPLCPRAKWQPPPDLHQRNWQRRHSGESSRPTAEPLSALSRPNRLWKIKGKKRGYHIKLIASLFLENAAFTEAKVWQITTAFPARKSLCSVIFQENSSELGPCWI